MHTEYHKWWSPHLRQEMELKIYGRADGLNRRPLLVFPAQGGRFYEYEDFGMIAAIAGSIEAGRVQVFTVDSVDLQSWANFSAAPADRARRHEEYDRYIIQEVMPLIRSYGYAGGKALTTGVSMGAYHAGNFFFRHPDCFSGCIALSGLFRLNHFIGDYMDDNVYFNTPLVYLRDLNDPAYLDLYRQSQIVVCVGQGAWEDEMRVDAAELRRVLEGKGVSAWIDFWGHDVNHDWPWWRVQMPYFLSKLGL
jgi:esterase/lipase superfamily enzyme